MTRVRNARKSAPNSEDQWAPRDTVKMFGWLSVAIGTLATVWFALFLAMAGFAMIIDWAENITTLDMTVSTIGLAMALTLILVGAGLLRMERWAWRLGVWWSPVALALGLVIVARIDPVSHPTAARALVSATALVYPMTMWWFLTRPHAASEFRSPSSVGERSEDAPPTK